MCGRLGEQRTRERFKTLRRRAQAQSTLYWPKTLNLVTTAIIRSSISTNFLEPMHLQAKTSRVACVERYLQALRIPVILLFTGVRRRTRGRSRPSLSSTLAPLGLSRTGCCGGGGACCGPGCRFGRSSHRAGASTAGLGEG